MSDRNWDAELAKIDKQLSSISDEQLVAEQRAGAAPPAAATRDKRAALASGPAVPAAGTAYSPTIVKTKTGAGVWAGWLKVTIAVAAAVGLMFWPWPGRCGLPLIGFTAATGAVTLLGLWSAVGTWRHRLGLAHAASLIVVVWGLVLGAREVLPRVGYAIPTLDRGAGWNCTAADFPASDVPANPSTSPPATPPAPAPAFP